MSDVSVARVIHPIDVGIMVKLWVKGETEVVDEISDEVRKKVLLALRNPTEAMIEACHKATVFDDRGLSIEEYRYQAVVAWQAMIDEALRS